jgi:hypothetical protein
VPDKVDGYQVISRIRQNMSLARMQKKIDHQKSKGYIVFSPIFFIVVATY